MNILDSIKDFIKKKSAEKFSKKVAKDLLPKIMEKAKSDLLPSLKEKLAGSGGQVTEAIEDAIKDSLKGLASDMVNEELDKRAQIPEGLKDVKGKIVEAAVDNLVEMAYDSVKSTLLG